ncbi:MAG: DMT family transporter [Solirubrobacterales bacterium]
MSSSLTSLLVVMVGAQLALQPPINSALGEHIGKLAAALVSFVVGTMILLLLVLVSGEAGKLSALGSVPVYELAGGLIGATYVATSTFTVARIGAGAVVAATITGQLLSSLAIDGLGLTGVDVVAVDGVRIMGALLLFGGTLLVVGRGRQVRQERSSGPARWKADLLPVAAVFAAGLLVGFQHPLNGLLSDSSGELVAGFSNFVVGTLLLLFLVVVTGRASKLAGLSGAHAWQFLGGLIGVISVVVALSAVSVVGAAGLTAALVTGQLLGSILIDRAGAFGLPVVLLTARRLIGVVLLLAGTLMCVY